LTQLGLQEAKNHRLNTGNTDLVGKIWVFDPADERFDPAKSLNAGAAYYVEGRDTAQKTVFQHFEDDAPEDQYYKFGLAIYNLGSGTVSNAHKLARDDGKTDATWEDLIENGTDSFLCQAMPDNWNHAAKY
jgi:sugar lactone lactonase YvrE